jgi:hypothetical protein
MNWEGEAIAGNGRTQLRAGQRDQHPGERRLLQFRVLGLDFLRDSCVGRRLPKIWAPARQNG